MNTAISEAVKPTYIKHLIECFCVLPQFSELPNKVYHKFVVFSVIRPDGSIVPSYAECNNCGAIHKVIEVHKSKRMAKETISALPNKKELASQIPSEQVKEYLEMYKCDITTWQETAFIYNNELWGKGVILKKEDDDGMTIGKYLQVLSKELHRVESFNISEDEDDND